MKIILYSVGKTNENYVKEGIELFTKRISHYYPIDWQLLPPSKLKDPLQIKKEESIHILKSISPNDVLILLDEKGKMLSSPELAKLLQQKANLGIQKLIFLIGGAFGVHESIQKRAQFTWSISSLVFPHMLVRLLLAEQIYRACSILANEKYHHE